MDIFANLRLCWYVNEHRTAIQLGRAFGDNEHAIQWSDLVTSGTVARLTRQPRISGISPGEDTWLRDMMRRNRRVLVDLPRGAP